MGVKGLVLRGRQFGTLIGLVCLCGALWVATPYFLTLSNLRNVAQQTSINAMIAVGMTFVIVSGGIDLSVGSILAFAGVVTASVLERELPIAFAILAGLATGAVCGLCNGILITWGRIPPFISTLGMMSVARGAALLYTDGRPISGFSQEFRTMATGKWLSVRLPVVITLAVYLLGHFVLSRTKFGRYVFAIGGNQQAARLSGVNVRFHKAIVYTLSGVTSALAAVILTSRLNSAQPIAGLNYELDAIAATVIGGTSLTGGEGSLGGTLIGALIIGVLRNGLNLLNISSFLQQIVIGSVIIVAALVDAALKSHRQIS